jgi:chromosome segregation ATPase
MADVVSEDILATLNKLVTMTDQSGNLRKDIKKTIFETVSSLRNIFTELKGIIDDKTRQIIHSESEINKVKVEFAACRREVAEAHAETSTVREEEPPGPDGRQVLPPLDRAPKLYSRVVRVQKRSTDYHLDRKPTNPTNIIEKILKSKVNPTEIKVGINSIRQLRDARVVIETSTKKETEKLEDKIRGKCDELDVNIQKLRNPRLVLINIPEDITQENVEETLTCQNPEQDIKVGDIKAKFSYITKQGMRNLVIEVDPSTRRKLITARIKLG